MITPQISWSVSNFMVSRLLDTSTNGFNQLILDTSATYGVDPITLTTSNPGRNLYLGRLNPIQIMGKAGLPLDFPVAILSVAQSDTIGRNSLQVTPSTFSGNIIATLDFYFAFPCSAIPYDLQSQFFAIEDAAVGAFSTDVSYAQMPPGTTYNDECKVEQGVLEFSSTGNSAGTWLQQIACTYLFRRVA